MRRNTTSGASAGDVSIRWREGKTRREKGEGRTDGIRGAECELEAEDFVDVEGVGVHDSDVHEPDVEVVGGDQLDAWSERSSIELG